MKYIKTIEYYKPYEGQYGYDKGDFVKMRSKNKYFGFNDSEKIRIMVDNEIGKIDSFEGDDLIVSYDDIRGLVLRFSYKDIIVSGKTKEEIEAKLASTKYNI